MNKPRTRIKLLSRPNRGGTLQYSFTIPVSMVEEYCLSQDCYYRIRILPDRTVVIKPTQYPIPPKEEPL